MIQVPWSQVWHTLFVGTGAYVAFVVLQRVSGKRTLSTLNAFDFVVTVAFGSTLATILLNKKIALVTGVTAFALLVALQYAATALSVRFRRAERLIKSEPVLLVRDGELLADVLKRQRVSQEEVHQAVRQHGYGSLSEIAAVVLETNGGLSVVSKSNRGDGAALRDVGSQREV